MSPLMEGGNVISRRVALRSPECRHELDDQFIVGMFILGGIGERVEHRGRGGAGPACHRAVGGGQGADLAWSSSLL